MDGFILINKRPSYDWCSFTEQVFTTIDTIDWQNMTRLKGLLFVLFLHVVCVLSPEYNTNAPTHAEHAFQQTQSVPEINRIDLHRCVSYTDNTLLMFDMSVLPKAKNNRRTCKLHLGKSIELAWYWTHDPLLWGDRADRPTVIFSCSETWCVVGLFLCYGVICILLFTHNYTHSNNNRVQPWPGLYPSYLIL